jgi:hypothetical protein
MTWEQGPFRQEVDSARHTIPPWTGRDGGQRASGTGPPRAHYFASPGAAAPGRWLSQRTGWEWACRLGRRSSTRTDHCRADTGRRRARPRPGPRPPRYIRSRTGSNRCRAFRHPLSAARSTDAGPDTPASMPLRAPGTVLACPGRSSHRVEQGSDPGWRPPLHTHREWPRIGGGIGLSRRSGDQGDQQQQRVPDHGRQPEHGGGRASGSRSRSGRRSSAAQHHCCDMYQS